jgi:hypothetical protein
MNAKPGQRHDFVKVCPSRRTALYIHITFVFRSEVLCQTNTSVTERTLKSGHLLQSMEGGPQ